MASSETQELILNSSFEEMDRLEPYVRSLQQAASFDDEKYNRILLTLSEAVNNAIIHGNRQNPDKKVVVQAELKSGLVVLRISDEGEGFNPATLADPLKEENLLKEGGRGIYLIRQYADEVRFQQGGSEVIMTFDCG